MGRTQKLLFAAGAGAAAFILVRWFGHSEGGHETSGGVVMNDAAGYDRHTGRLMHSFYRSVARDVAAAASPGAEVLEVGCGPGHLSVQLASEDALHVTGLDLDPAMIERARLNAERAFEAGSVTDRPEFLAGDAAALPFADGSFDVVVSTLSMHHWADPAEGLREVGRVLRPDGRALIWDIRPGLVPFHRAAPDPIGAVDPASLRVVSVQPWRWPWFLKLTQRVELAHR